jgi:hypothetical protein
MAAPPGSAIVKKRAEMITIDGSEGEGGGQILRTALGLSLLTGQPFRVTQIRAGRKKPGLLRQHLTAVAAATQVGNAATDGAEMGSSELIFRPEGVRAGDYCFAGDADAPARPHAGQRPLAADAGGRHAQSLCAAA